MSRGQVGDVMGDFEFAIGPRALCVHDALGDAFAVEVGEEVNQVDVLQEKRAVGADALGGVGVVDGAARGGGVDGVVFVLRVEHVEHGFREVVFTHDFGVGRIFRKLFADWKDQFVELLTFITFRCCDSSCL